jgi:predicted  nucleic acid-binding Zn-ribbon protein
MRKSMNIRPEVAFRELGVQHEFLKQRNLALAQLLAEMTGERDQLRSELDALKQELAKGGADGDPQ